MNWSRKGRLGELRPHPTTQVMQCTHIKEDNTRCKAQAMRNASLCFRHNPVTEVGRQQASSEGGKHNKIAELELEPINIQKPEDALHLLEETINMVRTGKIPNSTANTVGFLVQHSLKILEIIEKNRPHENKHSDPLDEDKIPEQQVRELEEWSKEMQYLADNIKQDISMEKAMANSTKP